MSDATPPLATLFDPIELEAAAAACCGRFGEPGAEAHRLATLRELLAGSSMLVLELEAFTKAASAHLRGVHCTANMQLESESLSRAVVAWTERVQDAANAYRDWQEARALGDARRAERRGPALLPSLPADFASIAITRFPPTA
jgi:hypothetical protein